MKMTSTPLSYALLGLILEKPRSGYDLRKVFASTPMGHYSSSPGAIYPALRRLEAQGLISGRIDRSRSLRPKQVFRSTREGTRVLKDWLVRPVTADDVIWRMDELMLRFAFHSLLDSHEATRTFLRVFVTEVASCTRELVAQHKALPDSTSLHGRLALESGIESYRAYARWARKALKQLSGNRR